MFIHYKTKAFILKKTERGEADEVLTVFSREFGRLEILAKAVRKIASKLRPGVEIFYLSDIEFIQGKTYKILTEAIAIKKFANIRKSLLKIKTAQKISEVFDGLVKEQEADLKIWRLLEDSFEILNRLEVKECKPILVYYHFFWKLVSLLGYEPELYHCLLCQKKLLPKELYFYSGEGGIICNFCQKQLKSKKGGALEKLSPRTIKYIRFILEKGPGPILRLKIEKEDLKKLKEISDKYYSFVNSKF